MSLRKMLVVSPEVFDRSHTKARLSTLDKEMKGVLARKGLKDIDKWHLYKRILDKYLGSVTDFKSPVHVPILETSPPTRLDESSNVLRRRLAEIKRTNAELDSTWRQINENLESESPPKKMKRRLSSPRMIPRRSKRQRKPKTFGPEWDTT